MAPIKEKREYGGANSCPKVSSDRFSELVSLYLDKEASEDELELLSLLIRSDTTAKELFNKSCGIHLATCKMFGKNCVLTKLPNYHMPRRKRISRRRAAFEWTAIAALMILSFVLFMETKMRADEEFSLHAAKDLSLISDTIAPYDVSVTNGFESDGDTSTIFKIKSKK